MNKKIEELIKESYGSVQEWDNHLFYDESFSLEKFAELIVMECIKVANDTVDDGDTGCCTNMAGFIESNIAHHFGVESKYYELYYGD